MWPGVPIVVTAQDPSSVFFRTMTMQALLRCGRW